MELLLLLLPMVFGIVGAVIVNLICDKLDK